MKHHVKIFFKYFFLIAMIAEVIFLIAESLMPGKQSSEHSSAVGSAVDSVITDLTGNDTAEDVPPESISITEGALDLEPGEKRTVHVQFVPADTSANHLKTVWASDDESVATVKNGTVTGCGIGTAHITVSLEENSAICDTVEVRVRETFAEALSLRFADGTDAATVAVGSAVLLCPVVTPSDASAGKITYKSTDPAIAEVSANGKIRGVSVGNTQVTATYVSRTERDGEKVTLTSDPVTVSVVEAPVILPSTIEITPPSNIAYDGAQAYLFADMGASFSVSYAPAETTEKAVVWSSSDENVLKIDARGKAVPVKKGKVTITAASAVSEAVSTFELEIRNRALNAAIAADGTPLGLAETGEYLLTATAGKHLSLSVTASPEEYFVRYETEDRSIAEVDDGLLLAYRAARTKLLITVADNADFSNEGGNLAETFTLSLTVSRVPFSETVQGWARIVRKLFGHFGAFLLLGILAGAVTIFFERKDTKWRLIALLLLLLCGFAFAGLTEILQLGIFTSGRGAAFTDVLIDFGGFAPAAIVVYGGYLIIAAIVGAVRKRKK